MGLIWSLSEFKITNWVKVFPILNKKLIPSTFTYLRISNDLTNGGHLRGRRNSWEGCQNDFETVISLLFFMERIFDKEFRASPKHSEDEVI